MFSVSSLGARPLSAVRSRSGRRGIVGAVIALALVAGGITATSASAYNGDGVALSAPSVSVEGQKVTVRWTVDVNRPVFFRHLQLANHNQPGSGFRSNTSLWRSRTFTTTQVMADGDHSVKVVYQLPGKGWVNGPSATYRVGNAPTSGFGADGVSVSAPVVSVSGNDATLRWKASTNRPVQFQYLQLANVGQPGSGFNPGITIDGTREFTTVHRLPAGIYDSRVVYKLPTGEWRSGPTTRYQVGGSAGGPTVSLPSVTVTPPPPPAAPVTTVAAPRPPAPTPPPPVNTGTTSSAPMPYPAKAVGLYYMMWSNSGSPKLSTIPAGVNVLNISFLQGDPPRVVDWSSQGEASWIADANALRARGVRIVASIGGAHGHVNTGNRQAFVNGVMAVNAKIPLDGIDWDIESSTPLNAGDIVWISTELKRLRGPNFAVTLAPNGSNIGQYIAVGAELHRAGALDMIAQQYYDAVVSPQAALSRIDQMRAAGIPENKIGIGMMVGSQDIYWTVEECLSAVAFMKAKYPNLRGGYLWEAGRAGTADWASRVGASLQR